MKHKPTDNMSPAILPPETVAFMKEQIRRRNVENYGEHWAAIIEMENRSDVEAATRRLDQLQGVCPRDKARPVQPWDNLAQVPGWDKANRINLAAAKQVYEEFVTAGKIIPPANKT